MLYTSTAGSLKNISETPLILSLPMLTGKPQRDGGTSTPNYLQTVNKTSTVYRNFSDSRPLPSDLTLPRYCTGRSFTISSSVFREQPPPGNNLYTIPSCCDSNWFNDFSSIGFPLNTLSFVEKLGDWKFGEVGRRHEWCTAYVCCLLLLRMCQAAGLWRWFMQLTFTSWHLFRF